MTVKACGFSTVYGYYIGDVPLYWISMDTVTHFNLTCSREAPEGKRFCDAKYYPLKYVARSCVATEGLCSDQPKGLHNTPISVRLH
jgi:hypothetical protein